jgi:hypothetical protein
MRRLLLSWSAVLILCAGAHPATAQGLDYLTSAYWAQAYGVKVVAQYAYCAYLNGLVILDVSKPSAPAFVGRVYCAGEGWDVDVWGQYAFLADGVSGVQVIDVSDPFHPLLVGHHETAGNAAGIKVVDGYAYLADGPGGGTGLIILDVTKPADPRFVGQFVSSGMCESVTIAGHYAYLGGVYLGLEIVDISDPHNPTLAAFYEMCSSSQVFVDGNIAYVSGGCGGSRDWPDEYSILDILDVSDPTQPAPLGEYIYYTGYCRGEVAVHGSQAFVSYCDENSVQRVGVIDVSDPAQPTWVGSVVIDGALDDLQIREDVLYAATGTGGFQTLDISVPTAPAVMGGWCEARGPSAIAGRDGLGYMGDGVGGLRVLDFSEPLTPRTVAHLPLPGFQRDVRLAGDWAYSVDFSRALNLVDVSDPARPVLLSRILEDLRSAVVRDGYAYLAVGAPGLRIYDLSDPQLPVLVGQCDLTGYAWDLEVAGGFAYVCTFHEGLQVVDVSDPTQPVRRGGIRVEHEYMLSMAMVDSYVYVPTNNQHLQVFDVSHPDHPTLALTYPMNCLEQISATGSRLYVNTYDADFMDGVTVLDVSEPLTPVIVGDFRMPGGCLSVLVDEPYLFVTAGGSLMVLGEEGAAVDEPARRLERLGLAVSNPASAIASIRFELPLAGPTRVDLLDVAGRHRATLHAAYLQAGPGRVNWDWRSTGLPSGTYFVRLRAAGREASRAVTLVR